MSASQTIDFGGWSALVMVGLAFYGPVALVRDGAGWVERVWRGWVRGWISGRHHAKCNPLNVLWALKVVRHAPTGRVGLCLRVCTARTCAWREIAGKQRWVAWMTSDAVLAGHVRRAKRAGGQIVLPLGTFEIVPLGEMTLAGMAETAAFEKAMSAGLEGLRQDEGGEFSEEGGRDGE